MTIDSCGFNAAATNESQAIRSPGYSTYSYSPNLNCTWILTSSQEYHVQLDLVEFDTERRFDVVTVVCYLVLQYKSLQFKKVLLYVLDKRR